MNKFLLGSSIALALCAINASAQTVTFVNGQKVLVPSALAPGQRALPRGYVPPAPTNPPPASFLVGGSDNCATADPIAGAGTFTVNTASATDSAQQTGFCPTIHNDVWFAWTSTQTGLARLSLCGGATVDTVVAAYPGSACPAAGSQLACDDDTTCSGVFTLQSQIQFNVTSGNVYLLQIGSYNATVTYSGTFTIDYPAPPSNDNCSTPTNVVGAGPFNFDNSFATTGAQGQSEAACNFAGTAIPNDIWFTWTATFTSTGAQVTTCSTTGVNTKIAIYNGSGCPSAASIACNDDACGLQAAATFPSVAGQTYTIQLGMNAAGTTGGSGTFTIVDAMPPANDDCSTPTTITGPGPFPFDNTHGTTGSQGQNEAPCLLFGSTSMQHDIWFTWTAASTGPATFSTCTLTTVDTKIAVYPGAGCPTNGTVLACNDDNCGSVQSSVDFSATAGAQYTLQIGTYPGANGGTGSFSVTIAGPPPPPVAASLNVDIGSPTAGYGVPTNAYGGAAAQPGYWNARSSGATGTLPPLNDLNGANSSVLLTHSGGNTDFSFNNAGTSGDDQALMDDAQDLGSGSATWTFSNLYGGNYSVYTYAWAPDSATYVSNVSVAGSSDPIQTVGGAWPGTQTLGVTYALHHVTGVPFGGSIVITIGTAAILGTLNGFQIVETSSPFTGYCFGDGTGTACPCANSGAAGNGCANSVNANGANISASGAASVGADTLVLSGTGMPNSSCLYFQGTTQISTVFGDGLRCAGGQIFRLGTEVNSGGASQYPNAGEFSISIRGFVPPAGGVRTYQCWYRNPASFCTPSTFNLSNGVQVTWTP